MKKYKNARILILGILMISVILTACSQNTAETDQTKTESTVTTTVAAESTTENTTEKGTTKSEATTKKSSNSDTTTKPAEQKSAGQTTTKKVTTTQMQTTTQRQTTTKKVTTTQKPTTTKKISTTEFEWDCNVDGHSCEVGPIGWVNSFDEATDKALEYIANHDASGNFRVMQCHMCGKYTAEITLR